MASSPFRPSLYRSLCRAVICMVVASIVMQTAPAQSPRKAKRTLRALGLLEVLPSGKARLVPVAILVDGKFYDASAYKAAPVPLALYSETVYEAEKTGVSQGLFTVDGALRGENTWIAEGTWQPGGAPAKARHSATPSKLEQDEGPPVLRKKDSDKASPSSQQPLPAPPETKPSTSAPGTHPKSATPTSVPSDAGLPDAGGNSPDENDPNRPLLRRGKTQPLGNTQSHAPSKATEADAHPKPSADKPGNANETTQLIPAISDADGPELRPYTYDLKPAEEQSYRKKMLAMASAAIQARSRQIVPVLPGTKPAPHPPVGKVAEPSIEEIQFRVFDLSNTNEPVFVFSASAKMPPDSRLPGAFANLTYFITVVAKADIYGDLRKLLVNATDTLHLDQTARMELIDAVDADGDSRGELLFQRISDAGTSWAIYRAAADQLFPLFEGTPSGRQSGASLQP